jgi:deoxyadenosine/deoxycytidine kinase
MATRVKRLVMLEGSIGAGKTTALQALERDSRVRVVEEPVNTWTTEQYEGQNLLDAMYSGTLDAAKFQLAIMPARVTALVEALADPDVDVVVSERGPWSEREMFARPQLSEADFNLYVFAQNGLLNGLLPLVGKFSVDFVHLTLPSEHALERIRVRGRVEEVGVNKERLDVIAAAQARMRETLTSEKALGIATVGDVVHTCIDATQGAAEVARALAHHVATVRARPTPPASPERSVGPVS